jgi:hypothetical protein
VIFMFMLGRLGFLLSMFIQSGSASYIPPGVLNPDEQGKTEQTNSVERRIKIYQTASARIQRSIQEAVSKEEFQSVPDKLKIWTSLISGSLEDIEANLNKKKKSNALIDYEIHLRRAVATTKDLKIRASVDQQEIFDSCLAQAEKVRRRFVQILFPH